MTATTAKFIIGFCRGYGWYLGSDPITTYYQTSDINQAIRFDSRDAALAAIAKYYDYNHNGPANKTRWFIESI